MKPIIFSTPMVQAILAGRKTQTRRAIKPQPSWGRVITEQEAFNRKRWLTAPYRSGAKLYVKETWANISDWADVDPEVGVFDGYIYKADWEDGTEAPKWRPSVHMPRGAARVFLRVTGVRVGRVQDITPGDCLDEGVMNETCYNCLLQAGKCRPQRDVDIFCGGDDAIIDKYAELWGSLNAKRGYGWDANPWVWVIEFERDESQ